jgi:hypothetical protein
MFAALNTSINYNKTIAGILLGEDLAFQAKEAGSNPTTRSKAFLAQLVERRPYKA